MGQVPLERDINIAVNGLFWVEVANPEHPFTAMLISCSRSTCLIGPILRTNSTGHAKGRGRGSKFPKNMRTLYMDAQM